MPLTHQLTLRMAIPAGVLTAIAFRYFGMNPPHLEVIYGAAMLFVLVTFLLASRIRKKKKVLGFDLAGQPYESEGYDLSSAPKGLRIAVQSCITTCYLLFWWLLTEGSLRLYFDR